MRYTDIKDMAGLDAARKELNTKLNAKGAEVLSRWEDTKEAYSTVNLLAYGLKSISGPVPFDRIVLWAIRAIRRFL